MNKKVEIITNCSCMTCSNPLSRNIGIDEELDAPEAGDSLLDVPQLLGLMHSSKEKNSSYPTFQTHHASLINDSFINERYVTVIL